VMSDGGAVICRMLFAFSGNSSSRPRFRYAGVYPVASS